jgi:uridylate kinase
MIKLSGEALMGASSYGIDMNTLNRISADILELHNLGVEIAIVVGAGNIFRGVSGAASGMDRATADYMGMLATVMNSLSLQSALEQQGLHTRVLSAIPMSSVCEPYIRRRAIRHMERKRVVICAAGLGDPFFTTDTAGVLRAIELNCDVIAKGTKVDGIYCSDPMINPNAKRYDKLSYRDVLEQDLRVMDGSAIALARDNSLPIMVFSIAQDGLLAKVFQGRAAYTIVN